MPTPEIVDIYYRLSTIAGNTDALDKQGQLVRSTLIAYNQANVQAASLNATLDKQQAITAKLNNQVASLIGRQAQGKATLADVQNAQAKYNESLIQEDIIKTKLETTTLRLQSAEVRAAGALAAEQNATPNLSSFQAIPVAGAAPVDPNAGGASSALASVAKSLTSYGAYFAIRQVTSAVADAAKETIDYAKTVQTLADETGLATSQASVYALAAKRVGITNDTVGNSFRTLSDRLSSGSSDAAEALKSLGVESKDSAGNIRPLEELLPEIFAGFEKLGPGIKTTQDAVGLFGRNADELLPLLIEGQTGLNGVALEAAQLGLTLNNTTTTAVRDTQKALADMDAVSLGLKIQLTTGLSPAVSGLASFFETLSPVIRKAITDAQAGAIVIHALMLGIGIDAAGLAGGNYLRSQGYNADGTLITALPNPGVTISGGRSSSSTLPVPGGRDTLPSVSKGGGSKGPEALQPQLDRIKSDFNDNEAMRQRDFGVKMQREQEDQDAKMLDIQKTYADKSAALEETLQKKIADLNLKWDDIILKLKVGGDQESIDAAEKAKKKALQDQEALNQEDRNDLNGKKKDDEQAAIDAFNLKRKRELEDYNTETADREKANDQKLKDAQVAYDKQLSQQGSAQEDSRVSELNALAASLRNQTTNHNQKAIDTETFTKKRAAALDAAHADEQKSVAINNAIIEGLEANHLVIAASLNSVAIAQAKAAWDELNSYSAGMYENGGTLGGRRVSRAFGGMVPGALGSPQWILAHGGERVTPPATASYFNNVRAGDQINITAPQTFNANVNGANAMHVARMASKEMARSISLRRATRG